MRTINRRTALGAIAAAFATPFVAKAAEAAPHPGPKPPPRKPMTADFTLTRRRDMYMPMPLWNDDGGVPDPTAITGCKLTILSAYGGATVLDDVSLGSGITVALATDPSGNIVCLATAHWNPAASIAHGDLNNMVTAVATLNVGAGGIITGPQDPFIILIMPGTTSGV